MSNEYKSSIKILILEILTPKKEIDYRMNELHKKILQNYKINFWLYAELLGIALILPAVIAFAIAFIDFNSEQIRIFIIYAIVITFFSLTIAGYVNLKILNPFVEYLQLAADGSPASDEIYNTAQKRFTLIPWFHSLEIFIRWAIGVIIISCSIYFLSDSRTSQVTNLVGIGFFGAILNSLWSFSVNEYLISRVARTGIFNKSVKNQRQNDSKLFLSLSIQIGSSILLLSVSILIVSFNLNSRTLTKAFENQMNNINESNIQILENFYSAKEQDITKFASDPEIIKLVKDNNWYALTQYLSAYLPSSKNFLEGVFIFTLDSEYTVVATNSTKGEGLGLKLRQLPFAAKTIEATIDGKIHFGEIQISPVTFSPTILLTTPIMENGKVIAGVGFPLWVGDFATGIIKNINIGSNGFPFFVTKSLTTISHKNDKEIMKNLQNESFAEFLKDPDPEKSFLYAQDGKIRTMRKKTSSKFDFIAISTILQDDLEKPALASIRDITIIAIITILCTGFFLYNVLNLKLKPLDESSLLLTQMAEGNLSERFNILSMDEIGSIQRSLYSFADKLSSIIHTDIQIANNLAAAADEIHLALDNLSGNTQTQASSSEEISASIEEISAGIDSVNARAEDQFSKVEILDEKMTELTETIASMGDEIASISRNVLTIVKDASKGEKSLDQMNRSISNISASSKQITNVMEIIISISSQINLLSLNAAIEAARAGDSGRGFAVVADEIGKLAVKTSQSIKNISSLFISNQTEIAEGSKIIKDTIQIIHKVIEGVNSFQAMAETLEMQVKVQKAINSVANEEVHSLNTMTSMIRSAMQEQKVAIEEVARTIYGINEITQSTAAGVEELSASSQGIAETADLLKKEMSFFKIDK